MGLILLSGLLLILAATPCIHGMTCNLERASDCTEELESILNNTKNEGRTEADKINMCTLSLKAAKDMISTNISKCFVQSTAVCSDSDPAAQAVKTRWTNITNKISHFCEEDCTGYAGIQICKENVSLNAIENGKPSEFCRSYGESRGPCLDELWCDYHREIYDALFETPYFKNYYQNVCLAGCSNLDETVNILQKCYSFVEDPDDLQMCQAHHNFTKCLQSFPSKPCRQFTSLIPFLYRYDYAGNSRLCQDEACMNARNCQSELQKQHDGTLGRYIVQSNDTTLLPELCLASVVGNKNVACYNKHITDCTSNAKHPIKAQWNELLQDIQRLCNTECDNVLEEVTTCHAMVEYARLDDKTWSAFCSSHLRADQCVRNQSCSIADAMFKLLLQSRARPLISAVCTGPCTNLQDVLKAIETCFPSLSKESKGCGEYRSFSSCLERQALDMCPEADDIINFLSPGYTDLRTKCTTKTISSSTRVTSQRMMYLLGLITSYLLLTWI